MGTSLCVCVCLWVQSTGVKHIRHMQTVQLCHIGVIDWYECVFRKVTNPVQYILFALFQSVKVVITTKQRLSSPPLKWHGHSHNNYQSIYSTVAVSRGRGVLASCFQCRIGVHTEKIREPWMNGNCSAVLSSLQPLREGEEHERGIEMLKE